MIGLDARKKGRRKKHMEKHTHTHAYIAVGLRFAMVSDFSAFNFLETNFLKPCEVHKLAPVFKETRLFFTT